MGGRGRLLAYVRPLPPETAAPRRVDTRLDGAGPGALLLAGVRVIGLASESSACRLPVSAPSPRRCTSSRDSESLPASFPGPVSALLS